MFFLVQLVKSRAEIKFTELARNIGTCWKLKNGQKIFRQNQHYHKKRPQYREQKLQKFELKNWSLFSESFIVIFLVKTTGMLQYWKPPEDKQNEIIIKMILLFGRVGKRSLAVSISSAYCDFSELQLYM